MKLTRRDTLKTIGAASLLPFTPAFAQGTRTVNINLLGFALGIHVPTTAAVFDILPDYGYQPETSRMDQIRTLTQTLVAGAAQIGEVDPITTFAAVEAGADLKIVGLWYRNTSLVFVADGDRIQDFKDLENPENVVAVNSRGDVTDVMLVGPLAKHGVDPAKVNVVEIGGSGARTRALLSGRVQAVPAHFDQAAAIQEQGNYKILFEPWKEYETWINEVWVVRGDWLAEPDNERVVIDILKAQMTAFRRANEDLAWFTEAYRAHATVGDAQEATEDSLRVLWDGLRGEVAAWPNDMELRPSEFEALVPVYQRAGAIQGTVDVSQVVEPSLAQQAVSELGS